MKGKLYILIGLVIILTLALLTGLAAAEEPTAIPLSSLSSAFTYQGQLIFEDEPYSGNCDFVFHLYDGPDGSQVGDRVDVLDVTVDEGLFTVQIDFGTREFTGDARWLGIGVRCPAGEGTYTPLEPKQPLTATPYALYANSASWSRLLGVPTGFADDIDNDTTYDAISGVTLKDTTFSADTTYMQRRVSQVCGTGSAIRVINQDGTITCQTFSSAAWSLSGNAGTTPGVNFLGTIDSQPFEIRVNSSRALRIEASTTSPNLLGGYSGNWLTSGVYGATIGGGGYSGGNNSITDNYGTIGGGAGNQTGDNSGTTSDRAYATVAGGYANIASGQYAAVGGGYSNDASGPYATIAGGYNNLASGTQNNASGGSATVSGGSINEALGDESSVGGGYDNEASGDWSTIGGGYQNQVTGANSTIGGGESNIASGAYNSIGGGYNNSTSSPNSTVGGGSSNTASNSSSTVGGGDSNTASGVGATVPGGYDNEAAGNYSFAAGNRAKADYSGCFVWGDTYNADLVCDASNAWIVRATGSVNFFTSGNLTTGAYLSSFGSSWNSVSSRELKENFASLDNAALLERLAEVPVTTWNYKAQEDSILHVGLMADEFNNLIDGLGGEGMDHINNMDAIGVSLAAVQGLYTENQELKAQVEDLDTRVAELEALIQSGNTNQESFKFNMSWLLVLGLVVLGGGYWIIRRRTERVQ